LGQVALGLNTKKLDDMPAASFFSSASSFFSCSRATLRRSHALLVGLDVARGAADLGRHLHFEVLQLRLRLLELEPHPRQLACATFEPTG
jgi:hypothetical protein